MYLQFTDPKQGASIYNQWIPRARFGLHIRLADLAQRIDAALRRRDATETARLVGEYFERAGFVADGLSGLDQIAAYTQLARLNQMTWRAAMLRDTIDRRQPPPYDYAGRRWVWWAHKLASRYGWTVEEIFNLWPEEAVAYLQEILVSEYDERDEARSLSQFGYKHDQQAKKLYFRPLPRPAWMIENNIPKTIRIHKSLIPYGVYKPPIHEN